MACSCEIAPSVMATCVRCAWRFPAEFVELFVRLRLRVSRCFLGDALNLFFGEFSHSHGMDFRGSVSQGILRGGDALCVAPRRHRTPSVAAFPHAQTPSQLPSVFSPIAQPWQRQVRVGYDYAPLPCLVPVTFCALALGVLRLCPSV
jgi:hypothetical protein